MLPRISEPLEPWPGYEVYTKRLRLYVRRSGAKGAIPILLLHGYAVDGWMFARIRERLEDRFDLIVPDLRGHGLSDAPRRGWTVEDIADDLAALLDEMEIPTLHAVGYSMGGFIALALAQRHPERVQRLGLLCTAPYSDFRRQRLGLAAIEGLFRWLPPQAMLGITARLLAGPGMPPEMQEVLPWLMRHNTRRGLRGGAHLLRTADLRPGLGSLRQPCLVVTAERDTAVRKRDWKPLVDHIPSVRHEHFEDAGHGLAASHSQQLAEMLAEFLGNEQTHNRTPNPSNSEGSAA